MNKPAACRSNLEGIEMLPIQKPDWLTIGSVTDESAILYDNELEDELHPLRKLIEPDVSRWRSSEGPPVVVTRIHAGAAELTGLMLSLQGEPPPGEAFVMANGRVTRFRFWRSRTLRGDTARKLFDWSCHLLAWCWPDEIAEFTNRNLLCHGLRSFRPRGISHVEMYTRCRRQEVVEKNRDPQ